MCLFLVVCIFVVDEILLMSLAILPLNLTGNLQSLRLLCCVLLNTNKACVLHAALCGEEKAELTEQCSSS